MLQSDVKMKPQQKRPKTTSSESALNIRNFPTDLRWACNAKASIQRQDLREFVIQVLQQATTDVKLA